MRKDEKCSSKRKAENSKRKISQVLNQIKRKRLIRCFNCKELGHNKLRHTKASHEENLRSEEKKRIGGDYRIILIVMH